MPITLNSTGLSGNRRGFTLLEILIAVFILATVLSTVYAAYRGTFRIISDSEREGEIYGMARNTMLRIIKDLTAVTTAGGKFKFVSRASETAGANFMEIAFTSRAHLSWADNESSGTRAEISYYVDQEGPEGGVRLLRRDVPDAQAGTEGQERSGFVICEGLYSLAYKFTDSSGQEHDSWDSTAGATTEKNKIPTLAAVELKLVNPQDKERPYIFTTKVFLPAAASVAVL
ncbi:MAG: prepilin-type N-terminal cleavage/methylation domain-containing protein, partial [Deltaproteobacteria bacterium]|nr:prepilin-type N-terminal cleavage/methylation domain-containing protein [Deltaproteobacteria bacterium]